MYWRTVKQLLKNYSPTYSLPSICAHENDTVYKFEDQEKAQVLNDYVCSIATFDNDNKDDGQRTWDSNRNYCNRTGHK
jgi:hypothetical protein